MIFRYIAAVTCLILLLNGCGAGYIKNYGSKPILGVEDSSDPNIVRLDGIDLYFRAYNDFRDFEMWNVMLIPVYVSKEDRELYEEDTGFKALLGFLPRESGFSGDPKAVRLTVDGNEYVAAIQKKWINPVTKRKYGDNWTGFCGEPPTEPEDAAALGPTSPKEVKNWYCYLLQFEVSPPKPSQNFSVIIEGITKNGAKFEIPIIFFEKYEWYDHQPLI